MENQSQSNLLVETSKPAETKYRDKVNVRSVAKLLARYLPLPEEDWRVREIAQYQFECGYRSKQLLLLVEKETFNTKVAEIEKQIRRLPSWKFKALKLAFLFAVRVPLGERDDCFQAIVLELLETKEKLTQIQYGIARNTWREYWRAFKAKWCSLPLSKIKAVETDKFFDSFDSLKYDEFEAVVDRVWGTGNETGEKLKEDYIQTSVIEADQLERKLERKTSADRINLLVNCLTYEFEAEAVVRLDAKATLAKIPKAIRKLGEKRMAHDYGDKNSRLTEAERKKLSRWVKANLALAK